MLLLKGYYFGSKVNSINCANLPEDWQNKTSSFISKKCVILYEKLNCRAERKPQIFQKSDVKYFDYSYSQENVPNYNFYGTW